ncbi:hypothetical protein QWZ13_19655 [Reinekea marina]|uniref:hypothetical protein n=1 Tax=Reinekea marina TaxID=1310421 RepID=UPI0025B561A9|nr:hypothetical protein [Reinekea marina]MDN3650588.1 hypothetical protein [Reinekea marina]MDN3651130.1 hypothetical protein [Reinekea marina]
MWLRCSGFYFTNVKVSKIKTRRGVRFLQTLCYVSQPGFIRLLSKCLSVTLPK